MNWFRWSKIKGHCDPATQCLAITPTPTSIVMKFDSKWGPKDRMTGWSLISKKSKVNFTVKSWLSLYHETKFSISPLYCTVCKQRLHVSHHKLFTTVVYFNIVLSFISSKKLHFLLFIQFKLDWQKEDKQARWWFHIDSFVEITNVSWLLQLESKLSARPCNNISTV